MIKSLPENQPIETVLLVWFDTGLNPQSGAGIINQETDN
jgi:hypothetical protein